MLIGKKLGKFNQYFDIFYFFFKNLYVKVRYDILLENYLECREFLSYPDMYLFMKQQNLTNIIDVGSQYCDYAIMFSKFYKSKVYAYEPLRENFEKAIKNIKINNSNIILSNILIGNGEDLTFTVNGNMVINSHDKVSGKLKSVKLDDIFRNFNENIDLIKIDVEGFEYEVLKGAKDLLGKFKPPIIIEIPNKSYIYNKIMDYLMELNYRVDQVIDNIYDRDTKIIFFKVY